eukprot:134077_1
MGACCSASIDDNTRLINRKMEEELRKEKRTHKILFLGSGNSGKSTIYKQLQWLHLDGFSEDDALQLQRHIYFQIIHQMKCVIKHYEDKEEKRSYQDDEILKAAITTVQEQDDERTLTDELADAIQYIWKNDDKIHNAFNDPYLLTYQIVDQTTEYFWNDLGRIRQTPYIPSESDILNVRYRTTGVVDKCFEVQNIRFHVFDVGGQKSERKKWINCFNEVKAVVFVISLASYDMRMFENLNNNCMVDALELFDETIHNKYFINTHIILFLNKRDLFAKKIGRVPITECPAFVDYNEHPHGGGTGAPEAPDPHNYNQTTSYIAWKFCALNKVNSKQIYVHLTYAMDRENVDKVFLDVKRIVISKALAASGFGMA